MTSGRYAAALSEHPVPAHAIGEVIGQVLERVEPRPDLAALFVTEGEIGALDDMVGAVRSTLAPTTLIGTTAVSILGGLQEVEQRPAVALWAGRTGPVTPVRIAADQRPDGVAVSGFEDVVEAGGGTLLLLADPYSLPVDALLAELNGSLPDLTVIGGLASARSPHGNRLILDDQISSDGAVGALLPPGVATALVSQGCRPIGRPFIVTQSEGNLVYELAGKPAVDRLKEIIDGLSDEDRQLAAHGLHVGLVLDESKATFDRGDFLIRNVMGADSRRGAVAIGDRVEVGGTIQFHVRDAESADEDLRHHLLGRTAEAALVFTCNGRGINLFAEPDHDARTIHELLAAPLAGMFCNGEIGPVGGHNHLHGFTASVAIFGETPTSGV